MNNKPISIRAAEISATTFYLERLIGGFGALLFVVGNVFYMLSPSFLFSFAGWGGAVLFAWTIINHHILTTLRLYLKSKGKSFSVFYIFVDFYLTEIVNNF